MHSWAVAPGALIEHLALRNDIGTFPPGITLKNHDCLTAANDNGVSFNEIADFIEANPEYVFFAPR